MTSYQRRCDVIASTLIRRHFNIVCPLGKCLDKLFHDPKAIEVRLFVATYTVTRHSIVCSCETDIIVVKILFNKYNVQQDWYIISIHMFKVALYIVFVCKFLYMSRLTTKPTKWHVRPAKTQISLCIRPVWSVFAVRMKKAEESLAP